ncbi:MAG: HNH endonuclease [Clostridia bacterium]|nr:HNH endonuclease [Clostridia bacterium]
MIVNALLKNQLIREKQDEKQRERALMTDRLRYEILRRDGFKCQICGATADDGVKLHVDHIKPVSKGGKTERNNLRTLCERCNLGKGAEYDPNGKN